MNLSFLSATELVRSPSENNKDDDEDIPSPGSSVSSSSGYMTGIANSPSSKANTNVSHFLFRRFSHRVCRIENIHSDLQTFIAKSAFFVIPILVECNFKAQRSYLRLKCVIWHNYLYAKRIPNQFQWYLFIAFRCVTSSTFPFCSRILQEKPSLLQRLPVMASSQLPLLLIL